MLKVKKEFETSAIPSGEGLLVNERPDFFFVVIEGIGFAGVKELDGCFADFATIRHCEDGVGLKDFCFR